MKSKTLYRKSTGLPWICEKQTGGQWYQCRLKWYECKFKTETTGPTEWYRDWQIPLIFNEENPLDLLRRHLDVSAQEATEWVVESYLNSQ